jgi:putative hemin transport protein
MTATARPDTGLDALPHLTERFAAWRTENPRGYLRNAAAELGVSELEVLVASGDESLTRLRVDDVPGLLGAIARWGELRTMTRNDHAVLEQTGRYDKLEFFGPAMGQTVGDIDLRIFATRWTHAYGQITESRHGPRCSVQVFDAYGVNVHKVFTSDLEAFRRFLDAWALEPQPEGIPAVDAAPLETPRPDAEIDVAALQTRWDGLQDTHDFFGLLREFGVTRTQALRLAGPGRALPVDPLALETALKGAAEDGEKVMIFVGNHGLVQIFIGEIQRVVRTEGWVNILDPGFDLHVRDGGITHAWLVTKPTRHGPVRSLECYGARGETVLQLFGKRTEAESTPAGMGAILDRVVAAHAL